MSERWIADASQVEEADASQVLDPRVQTGNRDKRAKRAFNFVEEGTYIKQARRSKHRDSCSGDPQEREHSRLWSTFGCPLV